MTWARLDDGIYDHPKIIQAGRDARELFFASIVYSSRHLTDGMIPRGALRILQAWTEIDDPAASAQRLVDVGLWNDSGDHYSIHDYLDYQPSAEHAKAVRQARAEAGRKGGVRSGEVRSQMSEANEAKHEAIASASPKQNTKQNTKQNRTPYPYPSLSPSEDRDGSLESGSPTCVADANASGDEQSAHTREDASAVATQTATTATTTTGRKRRVSEPVSQDSEAMRLAALLRDSILAHTPDARVPSNDAKLQPWAQVVQLMLTRDHRAPPDVEAVIAFATTDEFWRANILSPGSLREKYDRLNIKRQTTQRQEGNGNGGYAGHAGHATHGRRAGANGGTPAPKRFSPEYYAQAAARKRG